MMGYDIVIKNGLIIDGTGKPRFRANVYIKDGLIVKVGEGAETGDLVIDAKGLIVCPGFLDTHNHSDYMLLLNGRAESFIHQGVTTLNIANCGHSPAPLDSKRGDRSSIMWGLNVTVDWSTFDEYFRRLERSKIGVNVRCMVGFGTVREAVMGFEMRDPTKDELDEMKAHVEKAFDEGVFALSTGLTYPPQCYSKTEEVVELAKVASKKGGVYYTHTRGGQGGVQEALEIGFKAKIPVQISHYTPLRDEGYTILEEARARGLDVAFDAYPYTAGCSYMSGIYIPGWAHEGGVSKMLERLRDPETRNKIADEWAKRERGVWPNGRSNTPMVAYVSNERFKKYEGLTINEVAEMMDVDLVDAMAALIIGNENNVMRIGLFSRDPRGVVKAFRHPLMVLGSDGWSFAPYGVLHTGKPHPRCYGTYPKTLGLFSRDLGILTLEEAVKKMTSAAAGRLLITDRGVIEQGYKADITIFNPENVSDNATYREPHQYPSGIEYVIVNGKLTIDRGEHTGVLAGEVLRYSPP
ncbi:MAG: D-aminoacylase [Candidatus Bathyarchaeia archaeon]